MAFKINGLGLASASNGTGSVFGDVELCFVNAVVTPLLGFCWCEVWVVRGCPVELLSHLHRADTADGAMPVPLGLVALVE